MPKWTLEVNESGFHRKRVITGNDVSALEQKALEFERLWHKEWSAHLRTEAAKREIQGLRTILSDQLSVGAEVNWDALKLSQRFMEPAPSPPLELLPEPKPPDPGLAHFEWLTLKRKRAEFKDNLKSWEEKKRLSEAKIREIADMEEIYHEWISHLKADDNSDISGLIEMVLQSSSHMHGKPNVLFNTENNLAVVDYDLPQPGDLPNLKEVKYVASRDEFPETKLKANEITQLYENICYQICFKTLFLAFGFGVVGSAVFNGWATFTDPATGNDTRACILSVHVDRVAFAAINLARVEPKACFRALKGVGSAELHGMVPVAPLVQGSRNDPRFVESVEVANRLKEGTNLAAIGWEDFEHLIREIFEAEFKSTGGEVRVTRASRDWGVDAVAFDPDPIRGGKIVIQAKRYTNTVEVSAVRDLYGTVVNEGATKGILVTTSTFGPEAYAFAKGKPLTLLDGSNLLHLFERHGCHAYIDLAEAKRLNPTPLARTILAADPSA